jgi:uncharacterized glyoxalase superfamily protein PhnB
MASRSTSRSTTSGEVHRRLVEAGVSVEGPPDEQEWGGRHVWFRDVDGCRMSVFG